MKSLNKYGIVEVAQHTGDITYERFVHFKMLAPQFWERMDSPLWSVYYEAIMDYFNKGEYWSMVKKVDDYDFAIKNVESGNDAWGLCFALIAYEKGEDKKHFPNDAELKEKLRRFMDAGIDWGTIRDSVLGFMKASPEVFADHLTMNGLLNMTSEQES